MTQGFLSEDIRLIFANVRRKQYRGGGLIISGIYSRLSMGRKKKKTCPLIWVGVEFDTSVVNIDLKRYFKDLQSEASEGWNERLTNFPHETCDKLTRQQPVAVRRWMAAEATLGHRRGTELNISLNSLKIAQQHEDVSQQDFQFYDGCVSQSISWLVSVSANLRRSHV